MNSSVLPVLMGSFVGLVLLLLLQSQQHNPQIMPFNSLIIPTLQPKITHTIAFAHLDSPHTNQFQAHHPLNYTLILHPHSAFVVLLHYQ